MKQHSISGGLSVVRALALAGAAMLGACGAPTSHGAPPPAADGGGAPMSGSVTAACTSVCDNARRAACGVFNDNCVADCGRLARQVPARCAPLLDAYLACAARARVTCTDEGYGIAGCDAQDAAVNRCIDTAPGPTPNPTPTPTPNDRCLPDSVIPADVAATLCTATPGMPVPHDCPGGAPSAQCVAAPSGEANVFCCAR